MNRSNHNYGSCSNNSSSTNTNSSSSNNKLRWWTLIGSNSFTAQMERI